MEKRLSPQGEAGTQATWYSRAAWNGKQTPLFPPPVAWRVGAASQGRPHADKRPSPLARVFCGRFQPGREGGCHALLAFAGRPWLRSGFDPRP